MATKARLFKVRINRQGYDDSGYYWGIGQPLYHFMTDDGDGQFDIHLRAYDREDAKDQVRTMYPRMDIKFYR